VSIEDEKTADLWILALELPKRAIETGIPGPDWARAETADRRISGRDPMKPAAQAPVRRRDRDRLPFRSVIGKQGGRLLPPAIRLPLPSVALLLHVCKLVAQQRVFAA
jgi:hypothetical protein